MAGSTAPPERQRAAIAFLVVHGITAMWGSEPWRAMTLLAQVVRGVLNDYPEVRAFECLDGALLVFPACLFRAAPAGKLLDASEVLYDAMVAAGKLGLATRAGIAHGTAASFTDTDRRPNVASAQVTAAARITRAAENLGLHARPRGGGCARAAT